MTRTSDSRADRSPKDADGAVRILRIGGLDRQACGGTHVASTERCWAIRTRIAKIKNKGRHNRRVRIALQVEDREDIALGADDSLATLAEHMARAILAERPARALLDAWAARADAPARVQCGTCAHFTQHEHRPYDGTCRRPPAACVPLARPCRERRHARGRVRARGRRPRPLVAHGDAEPRWAHRIRPRGAEPKGTGRAGRASSQRSRASPT